MVAPYTTPVVGGVIGVGRGVGAARVCVEESGPREREDVIVDELVRYGIIGAGMMGTEHLWNLQAIPGAVVTAAADPRPEQLEWIVAAAGDEGAGITTFADHRDLLDSGLVDAVVVVSPNHTHHDVVLDVLARPGMHALVEKPLCTTVADCRDLVEATQRHDGVVWMGLEYRYMPPVARLVADVAAGSVGRVRMVAIREHRFPFLPKIGDWNRFNRNTGGTLVEKCCHFFDLMTLLTGDVPVAVMASGGQAVNHLDEVYDGEVSDIDDHAFVIVEYADGAKASLDLCMFAEGSENQEEVSVVGDVGKAEAFLPSGVYRSGRRADGRGGVRSEVVIDDRVAYEGGHHGASYLEHLDFLEAIRTGGTPAVTVDDGLLSVAVGVAAHRAIAERRVVSLDEVLG
jgi:myo-inositol 2-dehydrogenase/D-chiro-inositol 1-dehydrogenase